MTLPGDAASSVPDGPPLVTMARIDTVLRVTVLHAAAADLLWQNREQLVKIHNCSCLRLSVLSPGHGDQRNAIELQWQPPGIANSISAPRR